MNPVYSSGDIDIIRSAYRARDMVIFDPCTVVFRAKVATAITSGDTYHQISYNTVSVGAYTDIKVGQMVVISETSDHTSPVSGYRDMRIADTPTASVLKVNESALPLTTDYFITVLNTYRRRQRVRKGSYVDGFFPFEELAPTIEGLPSCQFKVSTTTAQFSFPNVIGRSLTGGTITYDWDMPGVTYNTGSSSSKNPVVTAPHGHLWGRLTVIDSNGPTQWMYFQLIVQDPANPTLATQMIDQLRLNRTWQGHHATCRAFTDVSISQVMDGTRAVIISHRQYTGGTLEGTMDNVAFVGYLSKETNSTQSSSDKSVTFDLEGLWEGAGSLPFNPIAVRDVASPTRWDEIDLPTPQRVVAHVLSRYSTVLNLCSLKLDLTDDTWYGGDMDVNATSLGDAIEQVLSEINAHIVQKPSGELELSRDLRVEDDDVRDDADVFWTLTNADLRSLDAAIRHDEQTGRIIIGFRGYQTSRAPSKGGKAVAPAVTLGTSQETQTRNNQLMPANLSDANLLTAASQRAGDLLAMENPPFEMQATTRGNLSWMTPTNSQWIQLNLLSSLVTRGRVFNQRVLLESLEISYLNAEGDHDVSMSLLPETRGGAALVVAAITPNVSSLSMFVLPPLAAYGGNYGGPSTLNTTDDVAPRFNRKNMGGMGVPIPSDQSYSEGQYAPEGGKKKFAISFAVATDVAAGFTSVNNENYTITVSGSAQIAAEAWALTHSFVGAVSNGWGNWTSQLTSAGFERNPSFPNRITIYTDFASYTTPLIGITGIQIFRSDPVVLGDTRTQSLHTPIGGPVGGTFGAHFAIADAASTSQFYAVPAPQNTSLSTLGIDIISDFSGPTPVPGAITAVKFIGVGTNPFTGLPGTVVKYADAFYSWELDEEGEETNISLLGATAGLFINGATAVGTPPPYNPAHEYTFTWEGDGNIPDVRFEDSNYTDNANLPLYVTFEGPGVDD